MEDIKNKDLKPILEASLQKATSYQEYRQLVNNLVERGSTTGNEKTEALSNYTILNNKRMTRWDKTIKVSETIQQEVQKRKRNETWLVLTESWCGDAAHLLPVMNTIAELNDGIDFKVVLRDDNPQLMDQFLTNGSRAIPKLICIDNETGYVKHTFGPRPSKATKLVNGYKSEHGQLTPEFKVVLQHWYNKDKGQSAIADLVSLLG